MIPNEKIPNFMEFDDVRDANVTDLSKYVFLDRFSAVRNKYCFKIRQK